MHAIIPNAYMEKSIKCGEKKKVSFVLDSPSPIVFKNIAGTTTAIKSPNKALFFLKKKKNFLNV